MKCIPPGKHHNLRLFPPSVEKALCISLRFFFFFKRVTEYVKYMESFSLLFQKKKKRFSKVVPSTAIMDRFILQNFSFLFFCVLAREAHLSYNFPSFFVFLKKVGSIFFDPYYLCCQFIECIC